jgi:hypothetical protein
MMSRGPGRAEQKTRRQLAAKLLALAALGADDQAAA